MIILSIHIFPFEFSRFKRLVRGLIDSFEYIDTTRIMVHLTLNTNESILKPNDNIKLIETEFSSISHIFPCKTISDTINKHNFLGVNEHRRETIEMASESDYIIFLDSDLYFNKTLLVHHINSVDLLSRRHKYFVITPCTIKLWDNTWNILTHPNYINESHDFYLKANYHNIVNKNYGMISLKKINKFKWGGGWFNCISASLLKKIGIPKTFIGYGPDDTFIMECCKLMKQTGTDVHQYILTNTIVCEDIPLGSESFKKNKPNFREICNQNFSNELLEFNNRYKKETT